MADHQKIHPVQDPEAAVKPSAPLVPKGASQSEHGDPVEYSAPYPPTTPLTPSKLPKKRSRSRSCWCRCLYWTACLLLLLLTILGILAAIIYLVFQPKAPKYSIDSLRISQFNLNTDLSLYATFNVNITARNPNKRIGIYYQGGSRISVWYTGTKLCEGSWPKFYQGHKNTTVLDLTLTGQSINVGDLLGTLQEQQLTGRIPLNVRAKVPVRIKLGKLKLMKWKFLVKCRVVVDTLAAADVIRIGDRSCKFKFRF